jgi:hypothetical protein
VTPGYARVLETDNATGEQRYVVNMAAPYSASFTREQAERAVAWREENITGRYRYEIVAVEPWMTSNGKARERHDGGHGAFPMEECGDPACREAATRLLTERLDEEAGQA